MNIVGVSFSYADNSLQTRGLKLLQEKLDIQVCDMLDYNMPICNSNKSDGQVPDSVNSFCNVLESADILVFAISEATSHYSAGFKNAMDWLVVKSKFNAKLGTDYAITNKPIFVVTFTPTSKEPNGARHFDITKQLLTKLGANVVDCIAVNDAWKTVIPGGLNAVQSVYSAIKDFMHSYTPSLNNPPNKEDYSSPEWLKAYNEWNMAWKYEMKPIHKVNGIPWPRINDREKQIVEVPLKEDYKLRSMDYLDTSEARPIFEKQADLIIENKIEGIVDVGCRIGIINNILQERGYTSYRYMGYDTSNQPIEYAQELWAGYNNIEYRVASMHDQNPVDFDVDCVIWSGVLLYDPENHMQLFKDVTFNQYGAKHAIIQEPCKDQDKDKWLPNMKLNTIEQDLYKYAEQYNYKDWVVEANVFSGRRRIAHVWI
jgi:NAD(P)H-dependent FMN reductase/SAM-dependent methyltransferase